jgi:RNase P subunit RPR2
MKIMKTDLCKQCDLIFGENYELKSHIKEKHRKEIKCKICNEKIGI